MQLKKFLLTQFDREAMATQKAVERVPEGRNDWEASSQVHGLGISRFAGRNHAGMGGFYDRTRRD